MIAVSRRATLGALVLPVLLAGCASSGASGGAAAPSPAAAGSLPLTLAPRPTSAEISVADLMTRVYIFADDSMLGRQAGTVGEARSDAYLERELRRLGLEPAGENGSYFQTVPMITRGVSTQASLTVDNQPLTRGTDWVPVPPISPALPFGGPFTGTAEVIYGGRAGDVARYPSPERVRGKLVVMAAPMTPQGQPGFSFWINSELARLNGAAAVAFVTLDATPQQFRDYFDAPATVLASNVAAPPAGTPFGLIVSAAAARRLLGADPATLQPGAAGRTARGDLAFADTPSSTPARNVVAILRGSDPALRGQYVALGAHSDHVGTTAQPVDHDSLRAFNSVMRPRGAENEGVRPTEAQQMLIRRTLDSLRAVNPPRIDSVFNGADDDASGSMGILEIAEWMVAQPTKPRRSVLFVWHTAEEVGLFGSEHFGMNPTVPRDSIVANINIDMIGRGKATDLPNGGPRYLQVLGSRRLSTQLGDLVEQVSRERGFDFQFDYSYDADGHPDNYYCRSDHWNYARWGIPAVFFSTGGHRDYHQLTDEPQYLWYEHYARVTSFIRDVTMAVANRDQRPLVDKPKPDPMGQCTQ